jgi:hypothetical protein
MTTKKSIEMKILNEGTCPSLSGASSLSYQIGHDTELHSSLQSWGLVA